MPFGWFKVAEPDEVPAGEIVTKRYFGTELVLWRDGDGTLRYVEHHRTVGDWVRLLTAAGFVLTDVVEPEWPEHLERSWGGWSPLRGRQIPGTAIFVTRLA